LARIKARVEPLAAEEKARQLTQKKADDALALLSNGKSTLKMQETGIFGYSAKGELPRIGVAPEVMEAAFNLTVAAPLAKTLYKFGDRWYLIKLKNRMELNREDFPKQKEQLKQGLLPQKQQEALALWMKELKNKAKIEINPSLLAE
jgi:peptidyl-prolyl cis-trans isomerase D